MTSFKQTTSTWLIATCELNCNILLAGRRGTGSTFSDADNFGEKRIDTLALVCIFFFLLVTWEEMFFSGVGNKEHENVN